MAVAAAERFAESGVARQYLGEEFVDHHIMMFSRSDRTGLNHVSYEVQDIDDLWTGHEWLAQTIAK